MCSQSVGHQESVPALTLRSAPLTKNNGAAGCVVGKVPDCSQQSVGRSGPSLSGHVVCLLGAFIFYIYKRTLVHWAVWSCSVCVFCSSEFLGSFLEVALTKANVYHPSSKMK